MLNFRVRIQIEAINSQTLDNVIMRKRIFAAVATLLVAGTSVLAQKTFDIDLWENGLPNSNGIDKTQPFDDATRNFKPSVRVFLPEAD